MRVERRGIWLGYVCKLDVIGMTVAVATVREGEGGVWRLGSE
jgi:hypothetical protein